MKKLLLTSLMLGAVLFASAQCPQGPCTTLTTSLSSTDVINTAPNSDPCIGAISTGTTYTGSIGNTASLTLRNKVTLNMYLEIRPNKIQKLYIEDTVTIDSLLVQGNADVFVAPKGKLTVNHIIAASSSAAITIGSEATVVLNSQAYTNATTNISATGHTISVLTCGNFTALPLIYRDFKGTSNILSFEIIGLKNVEVFGIQYSKDGQNWVWEHQYTPALGAYKYTTTRNGLYRLCARDYNGEASYSNVENIKSFINIPDAQVVVYNLQGVMIMNGKLSMKDLPKHTIVLVKSSTGVERLQID